MATPERCGLCPHYKAGPASYVPVRTMTITVPQVQPAKQVAAAIAAGEHKPRRKKRLTTAVPVFPKDDIFVNRHSQPMSIGNLYYGADLFVMLAGPSLTTFPLDKLRESRGVMTMSVNNAAMTYRPHLWTHVDPVEKFHSHIWDDPAVIKLTPVRCFGYRLREVVDGVLQKTDRLTMDCPGVIGYKRQPTFNPATYLTEDAVCWGNNQKSAQLNKHPHIVNVMFVVFRIAYHLGFRRVYLLGCDFKMEHGKANYCFEEDKHAGAVNSNNGSYLKLNKMLGMLQPQFISHGFHVYNCLQTSGLTAFPFLNFDEALAHATRRHSVPVSTKGWYTKTD